MNLFNDSPLIIAHRGYSSNYPENTIIAFHAAHQNKADGIELDVMMSRDKKYMVIHDARLERTTDGVGWVKDHDAKDLRKLDAGSWFSPDFKNSIIPFLDEVLAHLGNNLLINIEIKGNNKEDIAGLMDIIEKRGISDSVLLSSFNHDIALHCKDFPFGILYDSIPNPSEVLDTVRKYKARSVHPSTRELTPSWMRELAGAAVPVLPWLVNDPQEAIKLMEWGAQGIFTDEPMRMRQVFTRKEEQVQGAASKPRKKPLNINQPNQ